MQTIFLTSFGELSNEEKLLQEIIKNFSGFEVNLHNELNSDIYNSNIAIILIFKKIGTLESEFESLSKDVKNFYIFFKSGDIHIDEANSEILNRVKLKEKLREHKNVISFKSEEILGNKIKEILTSNSSTNNNSLNFARINNFILESSKGSKYYNANNKLEEVAKKLSNNEPISIVSLKGIGGVGKSTLAIEYATKALRSGDFNYVVWLGIEEGLYSRLKSFVIEYLLRDDDGKQSDKFYETKFKEFIKENPKTLIILDNYSERVIKEVEIFAKEFKSNIIITSRQKIKSITTNEVDVDTLGLKASFEMFELNCARSFSDIEKESIKEIAKLLGGLPLALEISAKFLENYLDIEPMEYLWELRDKGLRVFDGISEDELPKIHKENLRATLQINEKHLQNEKVDLSLLKLFSLLSPEPISKELLVDYISKELEISSFDIKKSLVDLEKYSYIKLKDDNYSMHRLLQEAIRDEYVSSEKELITKVALAFIHWNSDEINIGRYGNYFHNIFLHTKSLLQYSKKYENTKVYLYTTLSFCMENFFQYENSLEYSSKAINIINNNKDIYSINIIPIMSQHASALKINSKFDKAIEYYFKVLELINSFNDKKIEQGISIIYNNIGNLYEYMGKYEKAIEYLNKALLIKQKINENNDLGIAITHDNLGKSYNNIKNYSLAKFHFCKALKLKLKTIGKNHPITAITYSNIGLFYESIKKYKLAIRTYLKALEIKINTSTVQELETALIYYNLSYSYFMIKKYFQSFKYFYESVKIRLISDLNKSNLFEIKETLRLLIEIRTHLTRSTPQEKQSINKMIDEINKLIKEKNIKKIPKLKRL